MWIINQYGVMHSIPDGWSIPAGAVKASKDEIAEWQKADLVAKAERRAMKEQRRRDQAQFVVEVSEEPQMQPRKSRKAAETEE